MKRQLVAEIVGPAGAGKSTLARALGQRDETLRTDLSVWGLPLSLLTRSAFMSMPNFLSLNESRRRSAWSEVGLVTRLNALYQLLGRKTSGDEAVVLDEGAVFALAKLSAFGNGSGKDNGFDGPMRKLIARWAETLDAIIWLDAPNSILAQRIRERAKPHRMKGRADQEICDFLARYRMAYERVIAALAAYRDIKVIRFSTHQESLDLIADKVLVGMQRGNWAHGDRQH